MKNKIQMEILDNSKAHNNLLFKKIIPKFTNELLFNKFK